MKSILKIQRAFFSILLTLAGVTTIFTMACAKYGSDCSTYQYKLTGQVLSAVDSLPVKDIFVFLSYYDNAISFEEIPEAYYITSDSTDNDGLFELNFYGGCGGDKSDLLYVYFYDKDSLNNGYYPLQDTTIGILCEDGYGERYITIYLEKQDK